MCSSHTAKLQDLTNPPKPLDYTLALVNSPHCLWEMSQPLTSTASKPNRHRKQDSILNWRLAEANVECVPPHKKLLVACKRETMPVMAPWVALFTQDISVGLKMVSSFLSSILSSTESSCWASSVKTEEQQQIHFTVLANGFLSWKRDSWGKKQTMLSLSPSLAWSSSQQAALSNIWEGKGHLSGELVCPQIRGCRPRAVLEEGRWARWGIIDLCAFIPSGKKIGILSCCHTNILCKSYLCLLHTGTQFASDCQLRVYCFILNRIPAAERCRIDSPGE